MDGEITKKYQFYGCQLSDFPQTDLAYDNDGKIIRSASFTYDYFIAEIQETTSDIYSRVVKNIKLT